MSNVVSQSFVVISKCFKKKGREGRAGRMMEREKMGMGQERDKRWRRGVSRCLSEFCGCLKVFHGKRQAYIIQHSGGKSFTFDIIGVQSHLVKTHN